MAVNIGTTEKCTVSSISIIISIYLNRQKDAWLQRTLGDLSSSLAVSHLTVNLN